MTGTMAWLLAKSSGGGGEERKFPAGTVTNIDVGGLPSGSDIGGKTAIEAIKMMVVKDLAPSISIASPTVTIFEKGTTQDIRLSGMAIKRDTDISKIELFVDGVLDETITGSTSFNKTYAGVESDVVYKVRATDATNFGEASKTIQFVNASYYGTEDDLTKVLQTSRESSRAYTFVNDKAIYKYPMIFGALTKITDSSGVTDYTNSFARTEEMMGEVAYYVYKMIDATTLSNFTFKFT